MSKSESHAHLEQIDKPSSLPSSTSEEAIDIEDDPHRAALEDDKKHRLPAKTWAAVFFLGFTFQPALAFSILGVFPIINIIVMDVTGTMKNSSWMSSAWTLAGTIALSIAGRLSDIFGRRYVLLFGQLVLIISYIVGATAHSLNQLIAAMAIGGFGTGIAQVLYPGITEILPNNYRPAGLAWTEINLIPMSVFGSLAGHALAQNATWRWIFIIGGITSAISMVGSAIFYFPPERPQAVAHIPRGQLLRELDYLGFFLYTVGLVILLVGLYQGGNTRVWRQAGVVVPIVLGALTFLGCFAWEWSGIPKRPLFPLYMLKKFREFTVLLVCIFVTGFGYYAMTSLIPQQLLHVYSTDNIKLGELQMAEGAGNVFGGVVMGAAIHKLKRVNIQLQVAVAMQTLFLALSALVIVACYVTASLHIPQRDLGIAQGSIGTFRVLGGVIGSTALNIVITERSAEKLPDYIAKAVFPLGLPYDKLRAFSVALAAGKPLSVPGVTPAMAAAGLAASREAWSSVFRIAFLVPIPFGVIATVVAYFVADPSRYFTQHVAIHLRTDREESQAEKTHE